MPKKKARTAPLRTTLTLSELSRAHADIERAVAERAAAWGSHGWAVIGTKRALRVEVSVPKTLLRPAHPVDPIDLSRSLGVILKPTVRMAALAAPAPAAMPIASIAHVIEEPLAPGARISVESNPALRAGIACVVVADDKKYLVTCGHAFRPGASQTAVFARGKCIANLEHNFLDDADQLDAAYCRLTAKGRELLAASASAETWFDEVLAPADGQGKPAVFYASNDGASDAITTTIDSFDALSSNIFNDFWSLSLSGLIRTAAVTEPGDSGSLLAVDDHFYGSCTGKPDSSYFTPLIVTLERMRNHFTEVELWHPD